MKFQEKAGRPTKAQENANRLRRAAKSAVESKLKLFEDQNENIWTVYELIRDYSLGKAPEDFTQAQYRAAKDYYEDWCKNAKHTDEALNFLSKLGGKDHDGSEDAPPMAGVVQFSTKAKE